MARLDIDFARPFGLRPRLGANWISVSLLVFGAALCLLASLKISDDLRLAAAQEARLARVQSQVAHQHTARSAPARFSISREQAKPVNQAINQLNLPWRDLLDNIEIGTLDTVALLSLEPDAGKRTVNITAETKTVDSMIDYVELLKTQAFFTHVSLLKHEINVQDPNRPVRFQVEVQWTRSSL